MRPDRPRLAVQQFSRTHGGIITSRDAAAMGIPSDTIQAMVTSEFLERQARGIYRPRSVPVDDRQHLIGMCLAHPGLLISHTTAGRLWGLRKMPEDGLHVLCPHGSSPTVEGATVHRCRQIDPVDIVPFDDGLVMTSPPRTVFDASWLIGVDATVSAIEHLVGEHCTFETVEDTYRRLHHPRRPGSQTMREALASRPPWRAAMQSGAEERVLAAIASIGLPTPVTQCPIPVASGRPIHADFGWPEWCVALEVDDPYWHDFLEERERDKRRDLRAAAVGWVTCRLPTTDRGHALDATLREVGAVLRVRGWNR